MYMHKGKNIIICKFNIRNKCKFGEKCKFRHLSVKEQSHLYNSFFKEIYSTNGNVQIETKVMVNLKDSDMT